LTATPDRPVDAIIVFTTVGAEDLAVRIAEDLVSRELAACVNILPSIRSIYRWEGKLWDDTEWLLLVKTKRAAFPAVREAIRALHSYELPEVIAVPVVEGDERVLAWIGQSVRGHDAPPTEESGA